MNARNVSVVEKICVNVPPQNPQHAVCQCEVAKELIVAEAIVMLVVDVSVSLMLRLRLCCVCIFSACLQYKHELLNGC